MKLTNAIARENIGRYIDIKKRIGGYYPKQIIEYPDGRLALKDPQGVCSPIEDTGFNVVHYDYFVQKDEFMEVAE